MSQLATKKNIASPKILSVSYKSAAAKTEPGNSIPEAIIITDANFIVKSFNDVAASVYGFKSLAAHGRQLFSMVEFNMVGTTLPDAIKDLFEKGYWKGDLIYNHYDRKLIFSTCCSLVRDQHGIAASIVISTHNISEGLEQEKELAIAENKYHTLIESLSEGVILINANGTIGAANKKAAEILGLTEGELKDRVLSSAHWQTVREDGSEFPSSEYPATVTLQTGKENNNVVIGLERTDGKKVWLSVNSRPIFEEHRPLPVAVVISIADITEVKEMNERLFENELLFRTFMKNSPMLGWICDEAGNLVYGNPGFLDIVGTSKEVTGKNKLGSPLSANVFATITKRNRKVLQTGKPVITEEELINEDGTSRYYLSHWFLLPLKNNKKLVGGHAVEITDKKKARKEIDKMYERYHFAINASSDAIWDLDPATGFIYLSDTFNIFSGYNTADIIPTSDWFFEKIHPQDHKRIRANMDYCLKNSVVNWEIEYRFMFADGTYRHLLDKVHAIYEDGKLTRVIGAMQDISERKKLEAQLLHEQVQKQKMINKATIKAQEKERNRICGELHDNVNQLLMSAKLHICVAKNKTIGQSELLEKANQYLLMAVEEIRGLSKRLTSTIITTAGLQKSIADIAATMLLLKNIQLHTYISDDVIKKLSPEQQLMVYRIIQEQSNNILKYAETNEAIISLKEADENVELIISDNGKGFDKTSQKVNGIGFINIFNRVDAYNGKVEIIASPGNGCTLVINFPLTELK
ncbi:MAG: PAS domain S-box protein [Ferruginibacter sp.]